MCDKCNKFDALMQEYLEYRPFKPSYMDLWLKKLVRVHLSDDTSCESCTRNDAHKDACMEGYRHFASNNAGCTCPGFLHYKDASNGE